MHLSPAIFFPFQKRCRITLRRLQLLLHNRKELSVHSSKVIHRKYRDRYILLNGYASAAMKNGIIFLGGGGGGNVHRRVLRCCPLPSFFP